MSGFMLGVLVGAVVVMSPAGHVARYRDLFDHPFASAKAYWR